MTTKKGDTTKTDKPKRSKKKPAPKAKLLIFTHRSAKKEVLLTDATKKELTRENIQSLYMGWLQEEGYSPKITDEGFVVFQYEGYTYWLGINETDQIYYRLGTYRCWPLENDAEMERALKAADYANANTKVAKAYLNTSRKDMRYYVEVFLPKVEDFKYITRRSLCALTHLISTFKARMAELEKEDAEKRKTKPVRSRSKKP
jgi:hypothetical protein